MIEQNLTERIVAGVYLPGDFLPNLTELMAEFGVSQPTMREALHLLESAGFIRLKRGPNGGSQVCAPDHADVVRALDALFRYRKTTPAQVLEVRLLLEPAATRLAAVNATDEELLSLPIIVEGERERDVIVDPYKFHEAKQKFHRQIAEMSRNPVISTLSHSLSDLALQIAIDARFAIEDREISVRQHEQIADKLMKRDADGAERAISDHLRQFLM